MAGHNDPQVNWFRELGRSVTPNSEIRKLSRERFEAKARSRLGDRCRRYKRQVSGRRKARTAEIPVRPADVGEGHGRSCSKGERGLGILGGLDRLSRARDPQ